MRAYEYDAHMNTQMCVEKKKQTWWRLCVIYMQYNIDGHE
jgi:hypothetical protein